MTAHLRSALVLILLFTLLTGLVLPLAMTEIGGVFFPFQAGGSLLRSNGKIVGSALIGQNFTTDRYFHPRPSATTAADPADASKTVAAPYSADASAGSNLGPTSAALAKGVRGDIAAVGPIPVPVDAVTISASGLDPHVSPETAQRQVARVAAARGLPQDRLVALVAQYTERPLLGFIGMPRVNILALNLALQLLFLKYSESMGLHDSEVMDDGNIDRCDAGLMVVVIAGRKGEPPRISRRRFCWSQAANLG